ncbi:MAG: hypothetical protein KF699_09615 [Phycisphaeraceae bacterium]|nr:hypothetical protein [Phycisphaeraceae bacterium]
MEWSQVLDKVLRDDVLIPVIIAGSVVLIVLFRSVVSMVSSVARERTRREIAAYIAEGSMTPEQGERLMKAGKNENS